MTILQDRVNNAFEKLAAGFSTACPDVQVAELVKDYARYLSHLPIDAHFKWIDPEALKIAAAIKEKHGITAYYMLNKLVLIRMMEDWNPDRSPVKLPPSITGLYPGQFERILDQMAENEDGYYDLSNDPFMKDMGILCFRLITHGSRLMEPYSGMSRKTLLRQGLAGGLKAAWFFYVRMKGFKPFFENHTHPKMLLEFNAEGFAKSYHRIADTLALNPEIKGLMGGAWFLDPVVPTMNPHLSYIRDVLLEGGAEFFYGGTDQGVINSATATSKTRRRMYEEGKYMPAAYFFVWPRENLIQWSKDHPELRG